MDNAMRAILEAAREYGFYVDRGDPPAHDFIKANFTTDSAWYERDLSSIVPANAHAVTIALMIRSTNVNQFANLRKHGNVGDKAVAAVNTQTAGVTMRGDLTVAVDSDRKIDYQISAGPWFAINLTVKGWWF